MHTGLAIHLPSFFFFFLTGHFVNLVKENTVFSGVYDILLEVADRQHITSVHNLSVTVCSCHDPTIPNCRQRSTSGSTAGATSIGIMLAGLILLAGRTLRFFNWLNVLLLSAIVLLAFCFCKQLQLFGFLLTSIGWLLSVYTAALCTVLLTCKKKIVQFPEETFGNLIKSNSESMGTDCKVNNSISLLLKK